VDEATLTRVIEILETDPDFYVPVKKLWLMVQGEGLALDLDLETFHARLAADDRFEFIEGVDHAEDFEDDPEFAAEMEREMEALGFFSGPRVKLASREMTAEDVFAGMARSLAQLNAALRGAWESRPEGDPEAEAMLQDVLDLARQLEQEVQGMIEEQGEQPSPEDEVQ
jgi:di/tripeptidase